MAGPGEDTLFESFEQPWSTPPEPSLTAAQEYDRAQLRLAAIGESEIGRTEEKVAYILHHFPDTRDSYNALAIRYWYRWEAEAIDSWGDRLHLDVLHELTPYSTIERLARTIQNTLGLFPGTPRNREWRSQQQIEFSRYLAERKEGDPETRFYLDETGGNTQQAYTGVAGVCVMDWRQYEVHHAALRAWREKHLSPVPIHFTEGSEQTVGNALSLLKRLRRGGLLFVGHDLPTRSAGPMALVSLFSQLVVDSLFEVKKLVAQSGPRAIRIIKKAHEGFDGAYLNLLQTELEKHLAVSHPNQFYVKEVLALPKGGEVLLEMADLLAGAMQRRTRFNAQNPKDDLAAAVFSTTGFDNPRERGAMYHGFVGPRHS